MSVNNSDDEQHPDEELVQVCKAELPYITKAYEVLVARHEPLVYQFSLRYLRSQSDAEEVVQEVFLRVFHYINGFESRSSFKTWLMKITQNQCSRRYNKLKRRRAAEESYKEEKLGTDKNTYIENPQDNEDGLAVQILNEMRKDDKEILSLRHLAGLSLTEISEVLDISNSAAKMRHKRAVERFKELFESKNRKM